jgi:hypothetical protein
MIPCVRKRISPCPFVLRVDIWLGTGQVQNFAPGKLDHMAWNSYQYAKILFSNFLYGLTIANAMACSRYKRTSVPDVAKKWRCRLNSEIFQFSGASAKYLALLPFSFLHNNALKACSKCTTNSTGSLAAAPGFFHERVSRRRW